LAALRNDPGTTRSCAIIGWPGETSGLEQLMPVRRHREAVPPERALL